MSAKDCVLDTVHCLYCIGRLYGMSTFTYDRGDSNELRVTFFDIVLLVGFLIFYLTLLTLNITNEIEFLDANFTIFNTGIKYLLLYAITMVIFSVCFNFLFRNKLWRIIMKVVEVDEQVSRSADKPNV